MNKKAYVMDEALEAMLKATTSDIENKMADDLLKGYDGESHDFSEKHNNDMHNLFKREQKVQFYSKAKSYAKRVAVIFIAVILISTIKVVSVSAWRVKFLNFIMEMSQNDSNIIISDDGIKSNIYSINGITLGYVPEGFMLKKSGYRDNHIYLEFEDDNEFFEFRTMNIGGTLSIDTENTYVKEFTIGGRKAIYSENNNISILVWYDEELMYVLTGSISEDEFIKIAENMKR